MRWDSGGGNCRYRMGATGKYDLNLADEIDEAGKKKKQDRKG